MRKCCKAAYCHKRLVLYTLSSRTPTYRHKRSIFYRHKRLKTDPRSYRHRQLGLKMLHLPRRNSNHLRQFKKWTFLLPQAIGASYRHKRGTSRSTCNRVSKDNWLGQIRDVGNTHFSIFSSRLTLCSSPNAMTLQNKDLTNVCSVTAASEFSLHKPFAEGFLLAVWISIPFSEVIF